MMAASPCAADGFSATSASARRSGEIADLIDLFSKTQYRAKEVTSQVRGALTVVQNHGGMVPTELRHQMSGVLWTDHSRTGVLDPVWGIRFLLT